MRTSCSVPNTYTQCIVELRMKPLVVKRGNLDMRPWECECGRPRDRHWQMCNRCSYLDGLSLVDGGENRSSGPVINALREGPWEGMTIAEIIAEIGVTYRSLIRTMKLLMRTRRLIRYWAEVESTIPVGWMPNGNTMRDRLKGRSGTAGRWVYRLQGR